MYNMAKLGRIAEVIKMQKFVLRSKPKKCSKSSNIEKPKI